MYLSELRVENFRLFDEGDKAFVLALEPGLTALVGENDSGKTAVIDAIRMVLGTRDQEFFRVDEGDFHQPPDGLERRKEIRICCKFSALTSADRAAFAEFLTYEGPENARVAVLYIHWKALRLVRAGSGRRFTSFEMRSGAAGDGPTLDSEVRQLLCSTYLRPLRDAERAMSSGRGSRLSQILQHTKEIKEHGTDYDRKNAPRPNPGDLSVLGIGDYADALLAEHKGIKKASDNLNMAYLRHLSFSGSALQGQISVGGAGGESSVRLRLLLEKLDLALSDDQGNHNPPNRGLGSNNLLFMACELLLLGTEEDGFPLLLIEEPEAHLHPQRQLRLMSFLQEKAGEARADGQAIQILVTTHSPNLASAINIENLVLLQGGRAFPLNHQHTMLDKSDYGFLKRFLDVTKANLFFARGVMIVEGDAENILFPTLAKLLDRDLTQNGVSIINVGGVGLRRYARIFHRKDPVRDGKIAVPIACVTDMDVMPDCAPVITGRAKEGEAWPAGRRWLAKKDFDAKALSERRETIAKKADGQNVKTFVSDEWTLEYDLALAGLGEDVWMAAQLALADDEIHGGKTNVAAEIARAEASYKALEEKKFSKEEHASHIYALFVSGSKASKPISAQYLAQRLIDRRKSGNLDAAQLRKLLPIYVTNAVDYVTRESEPKPNEPAKPDVKING